MLVVDHLGSGDERVNLRGAAFVDYRNLTALRAAGYARVMTRPEEGAAQIRPAASAAAARGTA